MILFSRSKIKEEFRVLHSFLPIRRRKIRHHTNTALVN